MVHKIMINLLAVSLLDRAIPIFITIHSDGSWWWDYLWPIVSCMDNQGGRWNIHLFRGYYCSLTLLV
jgi:hypothetical protein